MNTPMTETQLGKAMAAFERKAGHRPKLPKSPQIHSEESTQCTRTVSKQSTSAVFEVLLKAKRELCVDQIALKTGLKIDAVRNSLSRLRTKKKVVLAKGKHTKTRLQFWRAT